jgi:hypothetical protein
MITRYFRWVIRTAYGVDSATGFGEPHFGRGRGTLGSVIALFLTAWPFVLIGVIVWVLPISDGAKIGLIAIDAVITVIACIVLALTTARQLKAEKEAASMAWLAQEKARIAGQTEDEREINQ